MDNTQTQTQNPARVKLTPVNSQMISGIGYDPETKTCQVAFKPKKNGLVSIETLPNMSADDFHRFQNAASIGSYFLGTLKAWKGKSKTHDVTIEELF